MAVCYTLECGPKCTINMAIVQFILTLPTGKAQW